MTDIYEEYMLLVTMQAKAGCESQAALMLDKALFPFNVNPSMLRWQILPADSGKFYLIDSFPDYDDVKLARCIKVARYLVQENSELFIMPVTVEMVNTGNLQLFSTDQQIICQSIH